MLELATFFTLTVPRVSLLYALILLAITVYWWRQVWHHGRRAEAPRVAWWSVPGLLLLLFTPILEQPTFFALGAFALLVGQYWPWAYRRAERHPGWFWAVTFLLLGGALLFSVLRSGEVQRLAFAAALALLFSGGAMLVSALAWRTEKPVATPTTWPRWANVTVPEWPDLSITLTSQGAELKNVSKKPLAVSGWSPARSNSWLLVRDAQGHALRTLKVGETALLPLNDQASGVRVWYKTSGETQQRLFRADWTPARYQSQDRVLN